MKTSQRIIAAAATALLAVATPAAAHTPEPAPPAEQPAEMQGPPPSTHGAFLPYPDELSESFTLPACGSEITVESGDVDEREYRVLVDTEGNTVVESRGAVTADVTRASDGAMLDEVDVSGGGFETFSADGTSVTYDTSGASIVVAFDEVEAQVFDEAGLPQAFLFLSGELTETVTFESAPQPGQEVPPVASAEITQNSTEYVFDLCDLLDQAAAEETTAP
ncbi:hypothetical protein [Kocuria sabuli]|uniref:hypothetical protein n=1 Tax=Kocuria sabuli TaxID=3071448 RepID=UPI0034D62B1B